MAEGTGGAAGATFDTPAYLRRIGVDIDPAGVRQDYHTLQTLQTAHMRTIPYENVDVVLGKKIDIGRAALEAKMVAGGRGGYCFEQNSLMLHALQALGFSVSPKLARVRWQRPPEVQAILGHMVLYVSCHGVDADSEAVHEYLVDVGFGGIGAFTPLRTDTEEPQDVPGGTFRLQARPGGAETMVQTLVKGAWADVYLVRNEPALEVDLEVSNWWSCSHPKATMMTMMLVGRVIGTDRHHIQNGSYVIRRSSGAAEITKITDTAHLRELLSSVFGLVVPDVPELGRYLSSK